MIGMWCSLADPYPAEIVAGAGFDWLLLDTEHSHADIATVLPQLQAVAPYPCSPVVRPPVNDPVVIKRLLDVGAQSLLIPQVESTEAARAAVAATRYAPIGVRGVSALTRATRFGRRVKDYAELAHTEPCVVEHAIGRVRAAGKPVGVLTTNPAFARRCIDLGTTFTAVGVDVGLLARGADALARTLTRQTAATAVPADANQSLDAR